MQQAQLNLVIGSVASFQASSFIPAGLERDAVVSPAECSLLVSDMEISAYLRRLMTFEQMTAEITRICDLAKAREEFGEWGLFDFDSLQTAYACIDSGSSSLGWLYGHERQRLNQLKIALPTSGESAAEARERIQARIAARRQARLEAAHEAVFHAPDLTRQTSGCAAELAVYSLPVCGSQHAAVPAIHHPRAIPSAIG
ncbi:hypothetical protein SAMN05216178_6962 [Pseudomonas saponiphila]|uniref:Uncharacterized protein n=2 Tax=Pseudomonas saponiphila TaxID=556534 RepID=A0A1H5A2W6_9PSED|nr:hypothetical protein SAMN05216178_6962 [Pseudomonas saponiphila]